MSNTHVFNDSYTFTVARTGDTVYTVRLGQMETADIVKGLLRGLKNICGDAVGSAELSDAERVKIIHDKVARFEAGEIGDGVATVSEKEKELRTLFAAWLTSKGSKKGDADKVSRNPNGVRHTFFAIVEAKKLDAAKADLLFADWTRKAEATIALRNESPEIEL